jgi:hypothetical protein
MRKMSLRHSAFLMARQNAEPEEPSTQFRTAAHEAGHCVVDLVLGIEVAGTTIAPGPGYAGMTWGPEAVRAHRGKAVHDEAGDDFCEVTTQKVTEKLSLQMPDPGESRHSVRDIFEAVQGRVIGLMAGCAAEMTIFGNSPPVYIESDLLSANYLAGIICRSDASKAAFIEHAYQEALALVEQYKTVVIALAETLVDHPEQTLNREEIGLVIAGTLAREGQEADRARNAAWRATVENTARVHEYLPA